ncbi:hypothetical protein [Shinella zoogloeoides]|uniref:hypothetical protein n=1 Tax=Shinella zoogloeoides TaxID=352475 RepID=UPI00273E39EF|nr:hypothetical protein [Shinella zoogloeoides]WLR91013.1 hypothetical protein Q9316_00260 [Shinella zoogloeoides]
MIVVFDPADGRIQQTVFDPIPPGLERVLTDNGQNFLFTHQEIGPSIYDDYFVSDGALTRRPDFPIPHAEISLGVGEGIALEGLPQPCRIFVEGAEIVVNDGELTIESDMPAEYEILFDQWPFKPATVKVTINEA